MHQCKRRKTQTTVMMGRRLRDVLLLLVALGATSPVVVNADTNGDHEGYPFWITRVTKEEGTSAYSVRVEYEADTKPVVVTSYDNIVFQVTEGHQQLGMLELQVPKNTTKLLVLFFQEQHGLGHVKINLASFSSTMDVPRIQVLIQQGSHITFESGSDVQVDLSLLVDGNVALNGVSRHVLVKSDVEENTVKSHVPVPNFDENTTVIFNLLSFEEHAGSLNATFTLTPAAGNRDVEGILEMGFISDFSCPSSCLVQSINTPVAIRFYRNDHTGPFPAGFIGFRRAGIDQDYCEFGRDDDTPCYVRCEVVGDQPQSVQLSRISSNHDDDEADVEFFNAVGDYKAMTYKLVHGQYGDADYQCTARSATREITKTFSVNFVMPPRIDWELSTVTTFGNGSVKYICVATGNPAPRISFTKTPRPFSGYDLTTTQVDETTARGELFLHGTNGTAPRIRCIARGGAGSQDRYFMSRDQLGLSRHVHYYLSQASFRGEKEEEFETTH